MPSLAMQDLTKYFYPYTFSIYGASFFQAPWLFPRDNPNRPIRMPIIVGDENGQMLHYSFILTLLDAYASGKPVDDVVKEWVGSDMAERSNWQEQPGRTYRRDIPPGPRSLDKVKLQPFFPVDIPGASAAEWQELTKRVQSLRGKMRSLPEGSSEYARAKATVDLAESRLHQYRFYAQVQGLQEVQAGGDPLAVAMRYPAQNRDLREGRYPLPVLGRAAKIFQQPGNIEAKTNQLNHLIKAGLEATKNPGISTGPILPQTITAFTQASKAADPLRQQTLARLAQGLHQRQTQMGTSTHSLQQLEKLVQQHFGNLTHEQLGAYASQANQRLIMGGGGTGKSTAMNAMVAGLVAQGIDPHSIVFGSPTHSGNQVLKKNMQNLAASMIPDWDIRDQQFRTFHSFALSKITRGGAQSPLTRLGYGGWKLLGSGNRALEDAATMEQALSMAGSEREGFLEKLLKEHSIKGIGAGRLASYISQMKSQRSMDEFKQAMATGEKEWSAGGDARKSLNALLYAYEQARKGKRMYDLDDVVRLYTEAGHRGFTSKISAGVFDEAQDLTKWMHAALKMNTTPQSKIILGGDMGQPAIGMHGRLDQFFPETFKQGSQHEFTGNFRATQRLTELAGAVNMQPSLQALGTSTPQVSMSGRVGVPETYDLGSTFGKAHWDVLDRLFSLMKLTPEQMEANFASGKSPFAGSAIAAGQMPVIFQMTDEQRDFRKMMEKYLSKGMGLSPNLANQMMQRGVTEVIPGSAGSAADMIHLITTQQARSQGFAHPFMSVTRGGLWNEGEYYANLNTLITRATEQAHIFATSSNFKNSPGFDNAFQIRPGSMGAEEVPAGFSNLIEQAAWLSVQLHGNRLGDLHRDLQFRDMPVGEVPFAITEEQAGALERLFHAAKELHELVPVITRQTYLQGAEGVLGASNADFREFDDESGTSRSNLNGFSTLRGGTIATALGRPGLMADPQMMAYTQRYAEEMLRSGQPGLPLLKQQLTGSALQAFGYKLPGGLPTESLSAFMGAARQIAGRFDDNFTYNPAELSYQEIGEVVPTEFPQDLPKRNLAELERNEFEKGMDDYLPPGEWGQESELYEHLKEFVPAWKLRETPDYQKNPDIQRLMNSLGVQRALAFRAESPSKGSQELLAAGHTSHEDEALFTLSGQNISPRHLRAIALKARELAIRPDRYYEDKERETKLRATYTRIAQLAGSMAGSVPEPGKSLEVSEQQLISLGRTNPMQAFILDALLRDPQSGHLRTVNQSKRHIDALRQTILGRIRIINRPEFGDRLGIPRSISAAAPFLNEMAAYAHSVHGIGVRDLHNVLTIPGKHPGEDLSYQMGGTVGLGSLEQRLQDLLHHGGFDDTARHNLQIQLGHVSRVRAGLNNPLNQEQFGWTLNQLFHTVSGKLTYADTPSGLSADFYRFFDPLKQSGKMGNRTFVEVMELHDALSEASQHTQQHGAFKRSHVDRLMRALSLDPSDPQWQGLQFLGKKGFMGPDAMLPLSSIANPQNLVDYMHVSEGQRAKMLEEMTRVPALMGRSYQVMGGMGYTPLTKGQYRVGLRTGMHGTLHPWNPKKRGIGMSMKRGSYLAEDLFTKEESDAMKGNSRFTDHSALPPLYRLKIGKKFYPVRADQLAFATPKQVAKQSGGGSLPPPRPPALPAGTPSHPGGDASRGFVLVGSPVGGRVRPGGAMLRRGRRALNRLRTTAESGTRVPPERSLIPFGSGIPQSKVTRARLAQLFRGPSAQMVPGPHVGTISQIMSHASMQQQAPEPDELDLAKGDLASWITRGLPHHSLFQPPSPEQLAVYQDPARNLLIKGGPGGGKTRTMVQRMVHRAVTGNVAPSNMLALSYMHSGVDELRKRLGEVSPYLPQQHPGFKFRDPMTYYGLAHRVITKDHDPLTKEYPMLEQLGVKWSGRIVYQPGADELATMSPEEQARVLSPAGYLRRALEPHLQGLGMGPLSDEKVKQYLEVIERAKSNRTDDPYDAYSLTMAQGRSDIAAGRMSGARGLVHYQDALAQSGDLDFHEQLYLGKQLLDRFGMHAIPEPLQDTQLIAADEGQDNNRIGVGFLGSFARALGNSPEILLGMDPMQSLIPPDFGGVPIHQVEQTYAQELGNFQEHNLTRNYRSRKGIVSLNNAILEHPELAGEPKSPRQTAFRQTLGTFPVVTQRPHQPALYQQMLHDMLGEAGISFGGIKQNLDRGLHPLHGVGFKEGMAPGNMAAIFTRHQDRNLFLHEARQLFGKRLGLHPKQAEKLVNQLFRTGTPGKGSSASQQQAAERQFLLSLHAGVRSHDYRRVFQDTTHVGGGGLKEYLRRLFVGTSRPDEEGTASYYWTTRPFNRGQYKEYTDDPRQLQHAGGDAYDLGQNPLFPSKQNQPDIVGGRSFPMHFEPIVREHVDDLLAQGIRPDASYFTQAGMAPYAWSRARTTGVVPEESFDRGVHPSVGPRFWTREDLAAVRKNVAPHEQANIARRLKQYPTQIQQQFLASGQSPQEFLKNQRQAIGQSQAILDAQGGLSMEDILEGAGHLQYLNHVQNRETKNPGEFATQAKSVNIQVASGGAVNVQPGSGTQINVGSGHAGPTPILFSPAGTGASGSPHTGGPGGPPPVRSGFLPYSYGHSGGALGGGGAAGAAGGGRRIGPETNLGSLNSYLQVGRNLARIGDEMQYMGSHMQQTADSAIQEGGDYRHATMRIMRQPGATRDAVGNAYALMNQGNAQHEAGGGANAFSTFFQAILDPHAFGQRVASDNGIGEPQAQGPYTGPLASGDNGTQGYFDFTSGQPGTIGYLQQHLLPMYSDTQIASMIQQYLGAQNGYFTGGSLRASTDIMSIAGMTGMDTSDLIQRFAGITGLNAGGQAKDLQVSHLAGIMQNMFHGNLDKTNVEPFLTGMEQVLPTLQGIAPLNAQGNPVDQTNQAAAIFQLAMNSGMSSQNLPQVGQVITSLANIGESPDLRQQYNLARMFGRNNLTASPQYFQYLSDQANQYQQLAGMQLQQNIFGGIKGQWDQASPNAGLYNDYIKQLQSAGLPLPGFSSSGGGKSVLAQPQMSLQDVQIQIDNADIEADKLQLEQASFNLAQGQASFGFNQWMQTQQYGPIGADVSRKAYFDFQKSQLAAGYNVTSPNNATTFKPQTPFGLKNEEFYEGIENQRSMLVLGRSKLLSDASFQQQMKHLNAQENFYQRELELQNAQRAFDKEWGQRSLDMQGKELQAQRAMLPLQIAMKEFDKAQLELQKQYLPLQTLLLQQQIQQMEQYLQGQGPVQGHNVQPIEIIQQLVNQYKGDKSKNRDQDLQNMIQSLGLDPQQSGILMQLVKSASTGKYSLQQLMNMMGIQNDSALIQELQGQANHGAYAGQSQQAGQNNANLQAGGVGANWDQLNQTLQQDITASTNLAAAMSSTTGLTKRIGDLTVALSPLSTGIGTLANIIGTVAGVSGGAGGGMGIGGGGGAPLPTHGGVGGSSIVPIPDQELGKGPQGDPRNNSAYFWVNFLEKLVDMGMRRKNQTQYSHFGLHTPHVNADFHNKMAYGQHQGVDFAAGEGTPLDEFIGGEVRSTGFYEWGGEADILIPGGLIERYLHLSQIAVHPGQKVKRGQRIGRTGGGTPASGYGRWSSGSHSHVQYDYGNINQGINPWPIWAAFGDKDLSSFYGQYVLSDIATKSGQRQSTASRGGGGIIPGLSDGGIAMRPVVSPLGEKEPEAVIPLSKLRSVLSMVAQQAPALADGPRGGMSAGKTITIGTLVGSLSLTVNTQAATLSDTEKDHLITDTISVVQTAILQVLNKP